MDPHVLSAENYYHELFAASSPKEEHEGRSQWLGGLLANPTSSTNSAGRGMPANRKVSRAPKTEKSQSASPDESNGTRQRGRPRLDTRDQTAAERRRTQIRLAQRAYRQRKETTISGLNKRVTELEHTIGKMNKAFLAFNDKAISSGIGSWEPQLAQDLKSTMECFIEYARYMEQESDDEDNNTAPNMSPRAFEEQNAHSAMQLQPQPQPALVPSDAAKSQNLIAEDATVAALLGYTSDSQVSKDSNVQHSQVETEQAVGTKTHDISDWPAPEPSNQYRMEVPSRDISIELFPPAFQKSPPPPLSYSFHETSFARRLLRTALEGAYRLLTNPNTRSEDLIYFCKHTFTWTNRNHCIQWLEQALSRTARESLEFWGAPQLHIGGAGLHYPRTGFDTGSSPPPGWADKAPMGPLRFIVPENLPDGHLKPADDIEAAGFDGEWFDSNDVEQYLQTKGLFLDGRSSYVELDVDLAVEPAPELNMPMMGSPTDSSGDSNGYSPSPRTQDSILLDGPIFEENVSLWKDEISTMAGLEELDAGSLFDRSILSQPKDGSDAGFFASVAQPLRMSRYRSMSKRYIDVEKFIMTMMQSAVCLGRTPGFRRSAVDAALEAAIHVRF